MAEIKGVHILLVREAEARKCFQRGTTRCGGCYPLATVSPLGQASSSTKIYTAPGTAPNSPACNPQAKDRVCFILCQPSNFPLNGALSILNQSVCSQCVQKTKCNIIVLSCRWLLAARAQPKYLTSLPQGTSLYGGELWAPQKILRLELKCAFNTVVNGTSRAYDSSGDCCANAFRSLILDATAK